ncbi:MAG: class I SAM-dependent methyltransferase [Nitrospirae bacterium]|nr:class I SAM-dependent methyltransferase [Nitrospirota bacterium]
MNRQLNIFSGIHKATARDYVARMGSNKIECMRIARKFEFDYWDGDRNHGYGGFVYDGRWQNVAKQLIQHYGLTGDSKILDVGCGKGFLLHDIKAELPSLNAIGFDISEYAIKSAPDDIRNSLIVHKAEEKYPYSDKSFDLVLSFNTLHNLTLPKLQYALQEIERVGRDKYLVIESYRNEKELYNLQCWTLTCESFLRPEEWLWVFKQSGYTGDYEFIYFE